MDFPQLKLLSPTTTISPRPTTNFTVLTPMLITFILSYVRPIQKQSEVGQD